MMKKILLGLLILFMVVIALGYTRATDRDEMIAKYTNENSAFLPTEHGFTLHYRDQGVREDAPVLVLIHGTAASLHTWEPWVGLLKDDFRIITLDLPGHGLTGPREDDCYAVECLTQSVDLLVEHLGIDQFYLGGNSLGGQVAWNYALEKPDRVISLILIDSGGIWNFQDKAKGNIGFTLARYSLGREILKHFSPRFLIAQSLYQTVAVESIITEEMIDRYWELLRYPGNREALGLRMAAPLSEEGREQVKLIETPTLIIWGREDRLIPVETASVFEQAMPSARLIILDKVGHLPQEEAAEESAQLVQRFILGIEGLVQPGAVQGG